MQLIRLAIKLTFCPYFFNLYYYNNNLLLLHSPFFYFFLIFLLDISTVDVMFSQNYYPVKINQEWGLIDKNGQLAITPQYEVISNPQQFGYTLMQQDGKIGLLNRQGQLLLPAKYEEIKILDSNFIEVIINGEQQIITSSGQIILKGNLYKEPTVLGHRLLVFKRKNLYGCVDIKGKKVLNAEYEEIKLYNKQFIKISKQGVFGLSDLSGRIILPVIADAFNLLDNGLIFYLKGVLWGAISTKGKKLIAPSFSGYQAINPTLIKLERFGEHWLFNIPEQKIVSSSSAKDFLPFSDKYILTQLGGKFGLVDYRAQEILANRYQEIQSFSAEAFRVRNGWKWGLVHKNGQQLLAYNYDFIAPIRKGKALVKNGPFFGLINEQGVLIIPVEYSRITISGENIKAFKGEKWTLFYINDQGEIQRGGNFKKHFRVQIQSVDPERELTSLNRGAFGNSYLLDNFEWFFVNELQKWGLRQLSDGEEVIPPTYDFIQIERDLGYTIVGLEKQGQYRFDRTNYRFNYLYGIVNNEVGKLVTRLRLWDVRSNDFRNGSLVARVVFNNGRHGLMLKNGKFVKKDYGYIGEFKNGLAKISISGKISAKLRTDDKSLGLLPDYLDGLLVGSDMMDITIHDQKIQESAYLTCQDCKWGVIDTTAFTVVQPKYEIVQEFVNGVSLVKSKGKWGVIDQLGNHILPPQYDGVTFLKGTDNQMVKVTVNAQKYGLMDTLGQLLVDLKYDDLGILQEGRLAVRMGTNWGYVTKNGRMVIIPKFQKVASFSEGLAAVKYQRKWVFIDPQGQIQLDNNFKAIGNFKQGKAWVKTKEGVGFIDANGTTTIPFDFSQAFDFNNGIARVMKDGKYGLIDENGSYILKPKFNHIAPFDENGLAIVRYGNKVTRYGIINQTGRLITTQHFQKIEPFKEGRALVRHKRGYGFIDKNGVLVIEGNYSKAASFSEGRAMVQRDNRCGFIDLAGNEVIPLNYSKCLDFDDGKAVVYRGLRRGGVIDLSGNEIIEPGIDRLLGFKEGRGLVRENYEYYYIAEDASWRDGYFEKAERYQNGIAAVRKGGKWGLINRNGLNLISNKYDAITTFEKGVAKVQLSQFVGLANLKGELIIPPVYEYITYVGDDLYRVEKGGQIGYLRKDGSWVWRLQE